ncbi:N/A [soil metagenome]
MTHEVVELRPETPHPQNTASQSDEPVTGGTGPGPDVWQPQTLIAPAPAAPSTGWRRALYRMTSGAVNPGPSAAEAARSELRAEVAAPVARRAGERIAVLSTKGGVGKTTTTLMLGHTLAAERGDRVVALDANPDYGTLGYRVAPTTSATVRELLAARADLVSYRDVRAYTTQAPSRLEVVPGDADPEVSEAFTAQDYADAQAVLGQHYNLVLTDCGTGVLHDAMRAVLAMATQLVVVTGPAVDQARHADHLLRWLRAHARPDQVDDAVVVVNASRNDLAVDLDPLFAHFAGLVRAVIEIPYDPVLAAGGIDGLDALATLTRDAYLSLARAVTLGFSAGPPRSLGPTADSAHSPTGPGVPLSGRGPDAPTAPVPPPAPPPPDLSGHQPGGPSHTA